MGFWGQLSSDPKGALLGASTGNLGSIFNYYGNKEQVDAAEEASRKQIETLEAERIRQRLAAERAQGIISNQGSQGLADLQDYNAQAQGYIGQSRDNSLAALYGGQDSAEGAMRGQSDAALSTLAAGQDASTGAVVRGLSQGTGALEGAQIDYERAMRQGVSGAMNEFGQGLNDRRLSGLYQDSYTPSADYGFRQQQGEESINRANAARGGRAGGAALKQLSDFNQGLASQDYGDWANRQQGIAGQLDAQDMAAADQVASLASGSGQAIAAQRQRTAAQLGGLQTDAGSRLGNIYTSTGSQVGNLQGDLGRQMSSLYGAGATQAAGVLGQAAQQVASLQGNLGTQTSNLISGDAAAQASVLTGQSAQNANLTQSSLPVYQSPTQYIGQDLASAGQSISNAGSNAALIAAIMADRKGGGQSSGYGTGYGSLGSYQPTPPRYP